jgi:hypothetical protein
MSMKIKPFYSMDVPFAPPPALSKSHSDPPSRHKGHVSSKDRCSPTQSARSSTRLISAMNNWQIYQPASRLTYLGVDIAHTPRWYLGGEEDFGARDAGLFRKRSNGICAGLLITVGTGGVDVAIAAAEGMVGDFFAFGRRPVGMWVSGRRCC